MDYRLGVDKSWEGSVAWNFQEIALLCGYEFQGVLRRHSFHAQIFHYLMALGCRVAFHGLRSVQGVDLYRPVGDHVELSERLLLVQIQEFARDHDVERAMQVVDFLAL